jgi:hypothetical protein
VSRPAKVVDLALAPPHTIIPTARTITTAATARIVFMGMSRSGTAFRPKRTRKFRSPPEDQHKTLTAG